MHQTNQAAEGEYNAVALDISENTAKNLSLGSMELSSSEEVLQGIPGYSEEQGSLLMMIAFLFVIAAFVLGCFLLCHYDSKNQSIWYFKSSWRTNSLFRPKHRYPSCFLVSHQFINWKRLNIWACGNFTSKHAIYT